MSLIDDFRSEMAQIVLIAAVASSGLYGPTYATTVSHVCYIKQEIKNIKDKDGVDAVSSMQIYLDGHPAILDTAKITYGTASPPILKISKKFDEKGGTYCTIVYT